MVECVASFMVSESGMYATLDCRIVATYSKQIILANENASLPAAANVYMRTHIGKRRLLPFVSIESLAVSLKLSMCNLKRNDIVEIILDSQYFSQ